MLPLQGVHLLGVGFSSLSPLSTIFVILSPVQTLPQMVDEGIFFANVNMGIAIFLAGSVWTLVSYGLLRSMASSFVVTVRRLAGNN